MKTDASPLTVSPSPAPPPPHCQPDLRPIFPDLPSVLVQALLFLLISNLLPVSPLILPHAWLFQILNHILSPCERIQVYTVSTSESHVGMKKENSLGKGRKPTLAESGLVLCWCQVASGPHNIFMQKISLSSSKVEETRLQ